ncbi:MAG: hypothetical protein KKB57_05800 [Proteobacteria bacterium]|nr:hypothetical protein [Pseudomonadota bacterium]
MRVPIRAAFLCLLALTTLFFYETADARSRCDEMRYRYLQAQKQINTYTFSYKSLYADYIKHRASLNKLGQTISSLKKQLVILKRNYPNEPKMWQGKQNRIAWMEKGYRTNQKNLKLTVAELRKYQGIVTKNRAIYNQNYKAWLEYGCKR